MTTQKHLNHLLERLNEVFGNKGPAWRKVNGRNVASIGHFELSSYRPGRVRLYAVERIMNEGGGVTRPFDSCSVPAGEMSRQLRAVLEAIELARLAGRA